MRTVLICAWVVCLAFGAVAVTAETVLPRLVAWSVSMSAALLYGMALEHTTTHRKAPR